MKLAFDLDGVIALTYPWLREYFLKHFNVDVGSTDDKTEFQYGNYDRLKEVVSDIGLSTAHAIIDYSKNIVPLNDAISAVHNAYNYFEVPITIITARHPITEIVTRRWLEKWYPGLQFDLQLVDSSHNKRRICEDLGVTHYVDDRYKTVCELAKTLDTVFCYDWPYNRRPLPPNAIRAYKLNDVLNTMLMRQIHGR